MFGTAKTHPVDLLSGIGSYRGQQLTLQSAVRFWGTVCTDWCTGTNKHIAAGFLCNWRKIKADLNCVCVCVCVFHALLSQCHKEEPDKYWNLRGLRCSWRCCWDLMLPPPSTSGYRFWKDCTSFIFNCLLSVYLVWLSKASINLPHIETPVF
jgi:hypothetical protein